MNQTVETGARTRILPERHAEIALESDGTHELGD
jgi:hypothetical protein